MLETQQATTIPVEMLTLATMLPIPVEMPIPAEMLIQVTIRLGPAAMLYQVADAKTHPRAHPRILQVLPKHQETIPVTRIEAAS